MSTLLRGTLSCRPSLLSFVSTPPALQRLQYPSIRATHQKRRPDTWTVQRPDPIPAERWNRVSRQRQFKLWHVVQIEKEGLGHEAAEPCEACKIRGKPCWVYNEEQALVYGLTCSACRRNQSNCSHHVPHSTFPKLYQAMKNEVIRLRKQVAEMKSQVEMLEKERTKLSAASGS